MADEASARARTGADDVDELTAFIEAVGVWALAPPWVHRGPFAEPAPPVLRAAEAGLRRLL
ncbi:hypothetical protein RB200_41610 [Streptomyces sp. PmtG]